MSEEQIVSVKDDLSEMVSTSPKVYSQKYMTVYYCSKCQHRQIDYVMDDGFYENTSSVQEGCKQYYGDLNNKEGYIRKIKKYAHMDSILDVGCGEGEFLHTASRYFNNCCGIEPFLHENKFCAENIKYINEYFSSDLLIPQYDVIASFQVLEHIVDVNEFARAYHKYMKEGGIGVINVPNGNEVFMKPCFSQIVMQHINYFSVYSLTGLLNKNGFEILEIENDISAMEITVYFRKNRKVQNIQEHVEKLSHALNEELCDYNQIAIWGAGGKADCYASLLQEKNKGKILHIFDSDESKYGGYIGGLDISIEQPDTGIIEQMEAVVIFASTYNSEIIKDLTEIYNYKGKIIYIEDDKICTINR
ncbi:MAG: class I SAM-dependent methyltransferase [Anaerovibrio sp.]|nr:class I SAM-dependent methyltransferase [Anaerovibrio sp.]